MATTTASVPLQDHSYYPKKNMDKFADVSLDQLSCESSQEGELSEKALHNELINFDAVLSEVGFMNSIDQIIFQQLLSMYPTGALNSQVASLGQIESQLANLFKCDVYHHGCHFTAESESSFRSHLESQHLMLTSLYCCYCTKAGHVENCNEASAEHASFIQVDQLVSASTYKSTALPHTKFFYHTDCAYQGTTCLPQLSVQPLLLSCRFGGARFYPPGDRTFEQF